jgi:hypothetical protein
LYYKRRCGNAATLLELKEEDHVDAMIACNEAEKEVRLLLSKHQINRPKCEHNTLEST